jgi:UDPglucose 6-dehydrogenase
VKVAEGVGLDHRLGPHFLRAGVGWGGSCLLGEETVLVRRAGRTSLVSLERLFEETLEGEDVEILTWRPDGDGPEFRPIELLTRREYVGEIIELRTKMGRRLRCTADHPFVTREGRKLASELTTQDWLPLADGPPSGGRTRPRRLNVIASFESAGLRPEQIIMRPHPDELAVVSAKEFRDAKSVYAHPRRVRRARDILRAGSPRLHEAAELDLEIEDATFATATNGNYVPATIDETSAFWRVVGLYIAEGHCSSLRRSERQLLQWCFHPHDDEDLVNEVLTFWRGIGVRASAFSSGTSRIVRVNSPLLAAWWLHGLGMGANCYEQRLPDLIWDAPEEHKRAVLSGLWQGDGSWSYINGGPRVILEYGTVSRELADGIVRLLGSLNIVTSIRVGRARKSTVDTYWLRISGADQVERLLDLVPQHDREAIVDSIAMQAKRIAPTGYRRSDNACWVRVVDVARKHFVGFVYSLEVPPTHTFVTTAALISSNCFPKDSLALKQLAANSGYHFQLLNAVIEVNELQKRRVIGKLQRHLGKLRGKEVALLGLAFKAGTDDTREAPSLVLASRLIAEGANVRVWDPIVKGAELLPQATVAATVQDAVRGAEAAVIVTEWPELRDLARPEIRELMARPLIIDGRNLLDPAQTRVAGFAYEGIGRPVSPLDVLPETAEREPELER